MVIFKSQKWYSGKAILNSQSTLAYYLVNDKPIFSREADKQNPISNPQRFKSTLQVNGHEVKVFPDLVMYIFLAFDIVSGHYSWFSLNSQLIHQN